MSLTWPQWPGITLWPLAAGPVIEVVRGHVVPAATVAVGDSVWAGMTDWNSRLSDGPILCLAEFDPAAGRISCRRTSYKWLAVQDEIETGVTLVAVNGVVTARDADGREHYLLARRSPKTWKYGGMWELSPAGGLFPPPEHGLIAPALLVDQLREEMSQEAGIDDPLTDARPIGFYRDAAARSFNVILRARLARPLEEVMAATRGTDWDADATRWVSESDLPAFLAAHPAIDACRAILAWLVTGTRGQTSSGSSRNPRG